METFQIRLKGFNALMTWFFRRIDIDTIAKVSWKHFVNGRDAEGSHDQFTLNKNGALRLDRGGDRMFFLTFTKEKNL